jgi:peptidoglycan/LPS O-acetylase OafA/YrhL
VLYLNLNNRFDFVRLIAAWLVLYSHSYVLSASKEIELISKYLKFDTAGGLAVGVFFSISGYLVFKSLENSSSLKIFIIKRILRIYPALILSVLFSIFVVGLICTDLSIQEYLTNRKTLSYLKTVSGFNIKYELPGVFENFPEKSVNGSLWSIAIELRCYLVLGLISLLPFSMKIKLWIAVVILSSLMLFRPIESPNDLSIKFMGLAYDFNKFGLMFTLGCLIASYEKHVSFHYIKFIGIICTCILILFSNFEISKFTLIAYNYLIPFIFIWIGLYFTLLPKIPEKLGDISYGLYLFSFPIQQLLIYLELSNDLVIFIILATTFSVVLSAISWRFVEKPFLKLKHKLR